MAGVGLPELTMRACDAGDTAAVAAWLDAGGEGRVDAMWGAQNGTVCGVTLLTLLMTASASGHEPLVEMLLERGASLDLQESNGGTALMAAACKGHTSIVRRLLQAGAQWELRNIDGCTALRYAQLMGHSECVRAIEEHEAAAAAAARAGGEPASSTQAVSEGEAAAEGTVPESIVDACQVEAAGVSIPDKVMNACMNGDAAAVAA